MRAFSFLILGLFWNVGTLAHAASEYDFRWLDPDKKVYVLQNRKYAKSESVVASLMGGVALNETYRNVYQIQPRLGYWFNEDIGIEAFFSGRIHQENAEYQALLQAVGTGTSPLVREITNTWGLLLNWAPWYAKINVFDSILYFDWLFSAGVGGMSSRIGERSVESRPSTWKNESLLAVHLGTGQMFHITESLSLRLDYMVHLYSAATYGGLAGAPGGESWFSTSTFNIGVGLKL